MTTSPLRYELLLPDDTSVDSFDCGDSEVTNYFANRGWLKPGGKVSPPVYRFQDAQTLAVIGYAAAGFMNCPHPNDASATKAKCLRIDAAGVNLAFQGSSPPNQGDSYATWMFRELEALAQEQRQAKTCVGMTLWVRSVNARAIAFYAKVGFVADPGGPEQRFDGPPHLTMRKLF